MIELTPLLSWNEKTYNDNHKVITSYYSNNTQTNTIWNCCSKESEITADGTEYVYSYNILKQMISRTKKGTASSVDLVTNYTYDVEGRRLSSNTASGGLNLATAATYDVAGRILTSTDALGLITTYAYTNSGRTVTVTSKGATTITNKYFDGRIKSVTGTATIPKYYTYGINANGAQWSQVNTASSNSPRYVKSTTDTLGRIIKIERPAFVGASALVSENFYNSKGQLVRTSQTESADTLYEYDDLSSVIRSGLDVNNDGVLTLASSDRISESDTSFSQSAIPSAWAQVTTSKTYATDNDATATTTSISKRQLTNLPAGVISKSISTDINGNETTSTTTLDRTNKTVTQTTNQPDSIIDAVSTTVNRLLQSQKTAKNLTYSYTYDALGRRTSVTDPRTGATATTYHASGMGKTGKVHTVTDAASNTTTFDYSATTGRRTKVTNALAKDTIYTYNNRGQVTSVTGPATYPLGYIYDSYGTMTELHTYRDGLTPDKTIWNYDTATGLLISKTDAAGKAVTYTYDNANRLSSRIWARLDNTNPLSTSYGYNANTAELTSVDYSDSTTDIAYTYNRLGQQATVTDAVGTRTFAYNSSLQPLTETINGLYSKVITRTYETSGMIGRYKGINIGTEYAVNYGYDTMGRFSTVTNGSDVYTYNYLANSNLVASIDYPHNIKVENTYESNRNLITQVKNSVSNVTPVTTISNYDYINDALGRRTSMAKSGTAFTATDTINYGYDDKSQVISADAVTDSNYDFGFDYDQIGNRTTADSNESGSTKTTTYTTNNLNQYTSLTSLPSVQNPTYDDDGNMVSTLLEEHDCTLTYNAENRLIEIEWEEGATGYLVNFVYDYMGRRVQKYRAAFTLSPLMEGFNLIEAKRYVYDGFKQIEELDNMNNLNITRKRIWSGEKLLADIHGTNVYYALADANKNITEYLDSTGTIQAHYEYSPFGKITKKTGTMQNDFDYRFSSEVFDDETGLVYYNFRFYIPELGRWTKKDPIAEHGGINLYGMVFNNPISLVDRLGLISEYQNGNSNNNTGGTITVIPPPTHSGDSTGGGQGPIVVIPPPSSSNGGAVMGGDGPIIIMPPPSNNDGSGNTGGPNIMIMPPKDDGNVGNEGIPPGMLRTPTAGVNNGNNYNFKGGKHNEGGNLACPAKCPPKKIKSPEDFLADLLGDIMQGLYDSAMDALYDILVPEVTLTIGGYGNGILVGGPMIGVGGFFDLYNMDFGFYGYGGGGVGFNPSAGVEFGLFFGNANDLSGPAIQVEGGALFGVGGTATIPGAGGDVNTGITVSVGVGGGADISMPVTGTLLNDNQ